MLLLTLMLMMMLILLMVTAHLLTVMSFFNVQSVAAPDAYADKLQVLICMSLMMLMIGPNAKAWQNIGPRAASLIVWRAGFNVVCS